MISDTVEAALWRETSHLAKDILSYKFPGIGSVAETYSPIGGRDPGLQLETFLRDDCAVVSLDSIRMWLGHQLQPAT